MTKKLILLFVMLLIVVLGNWGSAVAQHPAQITGTIRGVEPGIYSFSYQQYDVLSTLKKIQVTISDSGEFAVKVPIEGPTRAFLETGSTAVEETFTLTKGDGIDTTLSTKTNRANLIYFYLMPGDVQYVEADVNKLPSTLLIRGDGAWNSMYLNHEDWQFNSYRDKHLKNYFGYVWFAPEQYLDYVDLRAKERSAFLSVFQRENRLSAHLSQVAANTIYGDAVLAKLLYPKMRSTYREEDYQPDPSYYAFLDDIQIDHSRGDKGIAYFYFLDYLLREQYRLSGSDAEYYDYVRSRLKGRLRQEYYAFSLRNDFNRELYSHFRPGWFRPYGAFNRRVRETYAHLEGMLEGSPAPAVEFQTVDDSRWTWEQASGKLIYIDFWATWCGPCIAEMPALDSLQQAYRDQPVVFLSISMDKEKDRQKWKDFVRERALGGVQVWANSENHAAISKALNIAQIPRFVLLDEKGRILDAHAPRPSDPRVRALLDKHL